MTSASLHWPGPAAGTRRHTSLLLAVALHGGLIAALLHGLHATLERPEPREVVISLLSVSADTPQASTPQFAPAPRPPQPVAAAPATPAPLAQAVQQAQPAPQPVAVAHEAPAAVVPPAAPASSVSPSAHEVRTAPVAPAPAPVAVAAPAPTPAPAPVAAPPARGPVTVSGVEYLSPPKVEYPISARRAGLEGKVMLRLLIDEKGLPQRADIQQSSGHSRLDEAARAAALRAVFRPHVEDGHPLPVYALVPISFSLK